MLLRVFRSGSFSHQTLNGSDFSAVEDALKRLKSQMVQSYEMTFLRDLEHIFRCLEGQNHLLLRNLPLGKNVVKFSSKVLRKDRLYFFCFCVGFFFRSLYAYSRTSLSW